MEIPEYIYPEFEGISTRIVNKLPQNTVIQIASSVWKVGSRDIRDVLKIAKLCNPSDGEEDITRLISIHQKYRKTGKEYIDHSDVAPNFLNDQTLNITI